MTINNEKSNPSWGLVRMHQMNEDDYCSRCGAERNEVLDRVVLTCGIEDGLRKARAKVQSLFSAATIKHYGTGAEDLNDMTFFGACQQVGHDGTFVYAEALKDRVASYRLQAAYPLVTFVPVDNAAAGSPFAWAVISKDGRRALIGCR